MAIRPRRRPSGFFIGSVIGTFWGALIPPARFMLTENGVISFILAGFLLGAIVGTSIDFIMKKLAPKS